MKNKPLEAIKETSIGIELSKRLRSFSKQERENLQLRCEGMLPAISSNTMILGKAGSGKSVMLYELLLGELVKEHRVVLIQLGSNHRKTDPRCWNALQATVVEPLKDLTFEFDRQLVVMGLRQNDGTVAVDDMSFAKLEDAINQRPRTFKPTVFAFDGIEPILEGIRTGKLNEEQVISTFETLQQRGRVVVTLNQPSECMGREDRATLGRFLLETSPTIIWACSPRDCEGGTQFPYGFLTEDDHALLKRMEQKDPSENYYFVRTPGAVSALAKLELTQTDMEFLQGKPKQEAV